MYGDPIIVTSQCSVITGQLNSADCTCTSLPEGISFHLQPEGRMLRIQQAASSDRMGGGGGDCHLRATPPKLRERELSKALCQATGTYGLFQVNPSQSQAIRKYGETLAPTSQGYQVSCHLFLRSPKKET